MNVCHTSAVCSELEFIYFLSARLEKRCTALHIQKTITAYFSSKQLQSFVFALRPSLTEEDEFTRHIYPLHAKVSYLNFHPLEVVGRYRDSQLQVGENYSDLFNLRPNIL